jgi:hypothetical protein
MRVKLSRNGLLTLQNTKISMVLQELWWRPLGLHLWCNSASLHYVSNAELAFDVYSCAIKKQNFCTWFSLVDLYLGVSDNLFFWFGTSAFHVGGALFWLLIMWYWKNQFNEQVELKCFLLVKDIKKPKIQGMNIIDDHKSHSLFDIVTKLIF